MSIEANLNRLLQDELQQLKQDIVTAMQQAGKVVTGRTADAIQVVVNGSEAYVEAPSYLLTLESGRGPARGGGGGKQQFTENLKAWIRAKGISYKDEADLQRLAGFFRWYINKFGTKQYRQGGRKDIFTPVIERFKEEVNARMADLCTSEVASSISVALQ